MEQKILIQADLKLPDHALIFRITPAEVMNWMVGYLSNPFRHLHKIGVDGTFWALDVEDRRAICACG